MKRQHFITLLIYWLIGWAILAVARVALIVTMLNMHELLASTQFIPLALYNALRFDFQTLAYIATIPVVTLLVAAHLKRDQWVPRFCRIYYAIMYTLLTFICIIDLGFYKNFGEHFNVTAFDFFDEAPLTLLQTIWEEYPVLWLTLVVVLCGIGIYHIRLKIAQGTRRHYVGTVALIAALVATMRGSVTEFPLQVEDIYVSPSQQLNDCVPSAMYSLKKAWSEKKNAFKPESDESLLRSFGFDSWAEAWEAFGRPDLFDTIPAPTLFDADCLEASILNDTIPTRQPNVVIIFSESWSGYLCHLALQTHDNSLLCGMEHHLSEDLLFEHYQSVQNGTCASIENLVMATPFPRVFRSEYRYLHFPTSLATPFVDNGYRTTFISGMDQGWENVGFGLTQQGFEHIKSKYEMLAQHPEYQYNSIGIYDHHLFQTLNETLNDTISQPQLCFVMTTTNHPPFVYPDNVQLPALNDTLLSSPRLAVSRDVATKYLRGFQYINLCTARFLDEFKRSEAAGNTILLITGDHNVRTLLEYADDGIHVPTQWQHAVPLYIYLPPHLRNTADGSYLCDTQKYGSHYDILSTLAPLALRPGTRYLHIGQNLLDNSLTADSTYSYNIGLTMAKPDMLPKLTRRAEAREMLLRRYLQQFISQKE